MVAYATCNTKLKKTEMDKARVMQNQMLSFRSQGKRLEGESLDTKHNKDKMARKQTVFLTKLPSTVLYCIECRKFKIKAEVHLKLFFTAKLGLMRISRPRFKSSRSSMLISQSYV